MTIVNANYVPAGLEKVSNRYGDGFYLVGNASWCYFQRWQRAGETLTLVEDRYYCNPSRLERLGKGIFIELIKEDLSYAN